MKAITQEIGAGLRAGHRRLIYGVGIAAVALGAALIITGCNQGQSTPSETTATKSADQDETQGSTHDAAEKKGEAHEHANEGDELKAHTHSTKLTFSSQPEAIPLGKSATWTLKITDAKSGEPVKEFETEMTKQMHLIVVKKDLSWFNHLHPTYKGSGVFTVQATLPSAGSYKLYADYTPKGRTQEVPQQEVTTGGQEPTPIAASLVADVPKNGWLLTTVSSHPEGEPQAKGGTTYQVAMMPMPAKLVAGQAAMLHFQIRDAKGKPVTNLQPYLGTLGHCVILSSDTTAYLHSHPMAGGMGDMKNMDHDMGKMGDMDMKGMDMKNMDQGAAPKSGGPDVVFHTVFPEAGLYKAWGQFKHKGQIITAAFVVNVVPGPRTPAATDEAKPHSH